MPSLLDDALADIRQTEIDRALKKARIGTGASSVDSIATAIAESNRAAAEFRRRRALRADWQQAILEGRTVPGEHNNFSSFTDGGYVASVIRQTCACCGKVSSHLVGIFHVELHESGSRRMTKLDPRAQWPLEPRWTQEIEEETVQACPVCLVDFGFERRIPRPSFRQFVVGD